jgi:hypothetical protein
VLEDDLVCMDVSLQAVQVEKAVQEEKAVHTGRQYKQSA